MSPLAVRIGAGVLALLALIALRGKRWAYLTFVLLGLLYFPAQTHFRVHAPKCEQLLPTLHRLVPAPPETCVRQTRQASSSGRSSPGCPAVSGFRSSSRCRSAPAAAGSRSTAA